MSNLATGQANQPMDFQGRTGGSVTAIITQDPTETSVGLGKNTGASLASYNICVGLNSGKVNTGIRNVTMGINAVSVNSPVNDGVVIGFNAGKNVALDSNVFIGSQCGENVTFGSLNCGIGFMAMQSSTNGWYNTSLGSNSLMNNLNGAQNVALGSGAMQSMRNSNQNTVCGYLAGFGTDSENFAGSGNSIYGSKASYRVATANNIVSIGAFSGYNNGYGDENVTIGYQSGFSNVSATGLVTLGPKAGYSSLAGESVYVGSGTGYGNVDGSGNTCSGFACDVDSTTGSLNSYYGYRAGAVNSSLNSALGAFALSSASSSNCVAMGYESGKFSSASSNLFLGAGSGAYSSASECVFIGNGVGSYSTVPLSLAIGMVSEDRAPLITGNMDTSEFGKPGITCKGHISVKQNSALGDSYLDNGFVLYRNDPTVRAAWHMYIDDAGKYIFGKNGKTAAILQSNASLPDVPSLDFTGQHRCRAMPGLMDMVLSGKTCIGLPVQGCVVVSSGVICTAMGRRGQTFTDKRGVSVSQALPVVDLCSTANDKAVFGVVAGIESVTPDNLSRTYNVGPMVTVFPKEYSDTRVVINSLGEGAIWVCNQGVRCVENGDYLVSSSLPGVSQKQRSPCLRNSTIAKLTAGFDFDICSDRFETRIVVHGGMTYVCALLPCTFHCG